MSHFTVRKRDFSTGRSRDFGVSYDRKVLYFSHEKVQDDTLQNKGGRVGFLGVSQVVTFYRNFTNNLIISFLEGENRTFESSSKNTDSR